MRAEIKTLQDKYNADMKLLQNKLQQSEEHLKGKLITIVLSVHIQET